MPPLLVAYHNYGMQPYYWTCHTLLTGEERIMYGNFFSAYKLYNFGSSRAGRLEEIVINKSHSILTSYVTQLTHQENV